MTDNGSCYKSFAFQKACKHLRLKHIRTKPYTPKTNGKAERFIQTSLREWAYAQAYNTSRERGSVFTPSDFVDIASRASVDQSLSRLVKAGKLRRLSRGLYDFPKIHPKLGALAPSPDVVALALARETGSVIQIAGARAANALGLSTQVPAKNTYLTDGPPRRVVLGKRVIDLRHAAPKHLVAPGSAAGTVVQALRHLGQPRATDVIDVASRQLSIDDKRLLGKTLGRAPAWMRPTLLSIAQGTSRSTD